jgi:HAE1 family hydrophobic/amphiphilic exporter-1
MRRLYDFSERMFCSWERAYGKALGWSLAHKKLVLIGFSVAFVATIGLTRFVGNEFAPEEDTGDLRITVQLPVGTRLEETDKIAQRIEAMYQTEVPEARFFYARVGSVSGQARTMQQASGDNVITSGCKLVDKTKRTRSVQEVAQALRTRIRAIPGVIKTDVTSGNPIGRMITGMGGKAVRVEIIGNSFEETDAFADKLKAAIEKVAGTVDVTISRERDRPELQIIIDREKASSLGITMSQIAASLKTYIQGSTATKYREKGETYDVYVRLTEESRQSREDLENVPLLSAATGKQVRLSNIAKIIENAGPQEIERQNRERVVRVECNTYKRSMGKVVEDIRAVLGRMTVPADVMVNIGGEAEEQKKAFADLGILLGLGIILVYMVMAAQFESLVDPFIVMFSIPFTFIGVIVAFVLTGTTLSIVSYLGVIMLMGIVVNNAIVLISYIGILRQRGFSMYDAVTQGGRDRLRPVLMTTITTLAGLLPLAISRGAGSETWQPLGITMLGGLTVSTMITLLFVPTMYAVFHKRRAQGGA